MNYKQGVSKSFSVHGRLHVYHHYYVFFIAAFMTYSPSFYFIFSWHDRLSFKSQYIHTCFDMPNENKTNKTKFGQIQESANFAAFGQLFPHNTERSEHLLLMGSCQNTVYISSLKYTGIVHVIAISFLFFIDEWYFIAPKLCEKADLCQCMQNEYVSPGLL